MRRKLFLIFLCLLIAMGSAEGETANQYDRLDVGNPTPVTGKFFTTMWGGSTSDVDVQHLLHRYALVVWDEEMGRFKTDPNVVDGAIVSDSEDGNRSYIFLLHDDLKYSDGSPITARDYAFTLLFQMEDAIRETGGIPAEDDWILGAEEYWREETEQVAGIRILDDYALAVTAKAESLPHFHELGRLNISPYPIHVIAPGNEVLDDGNGAYLKEPITAEVIQKTVLDPETGYLYNPKVVSGPYTLDSFDGDKASFTVNPYFKGTEEGFPPLIEHLTYQGADNNTMISQLGNGEYGLLNKVTWDNGIWDGLELLALEGRPFAMTYYPRTGLTTFRFLPGSEIVQELAVRQALMYCMDRDAISAEYVGPYGMTVDGLYGLGEWQTRLLFGTEDFPLPELSENPTREELAEYEEMEAAWEELSLESLNHYELNVDEAKRLLERAGWRLNEEGIRERDGVRLTLNVAVPRNDNLRNTLETNWIAHLAEAGIGINITMMRIRDLYNAYRERGEGAETMQDETFDIILIGNDFTANLELKNSFRVTGAVQGWLDIVNEGKTEDLLEPGDIVITGEEDLETLNRKLYDLAAEVNHTEPGDVLGYMRKWIDLQEKINEFIPQMPLYSNVYFDFYTRTLHEYYIEKQITWADAIVPAYLSDPEDLEEWEEEEINSTIQEVRDEFDALTAGLDLSSKKENAEEAEDEIPAGDEVQEEKPPDESDTLIDTGQKGGD